MPILLIIVLSACSSSDEDKLNNGWNKNADKSEKEEVSTVVIRDDLPANRFIVTFDVEKAAPLGSFDTERFGTVSCFIQDGYLLIFDDFGDRLFELEADVSQTASEADSEKIIIADMDFDGNEDVGVLIDVKEYNKYYRFYLFNAEEETFEVNGDLSRLPNPSSDSETKTVLSDKHSSADESTRTVFVWKGGQLIEQN